MNIENNELTKFESNSSSSSFTASPRLHNHNLFAYDIKYSKVFASKKEQSDDDFYNTFNNLANVNNSDKNLPKSSTHEFQDYASIKEESFINKDILNILDSPSMNKTKRKRSSNSGFSDERLHNDNYNEDLLIKLQNFNGNVEKDNISPIIIKEHLKEEEEKNDNFVFNYEDSNKKMRQKYPQHSKFIPAFESEINFINNLSSNEENNFNSNKLPSNTLPYLPVSQYGNFFKFQPVFPNQIRSIYDNYGKKIDHIKETTIPNDNNKPQNSSNNSNLLVNANITNQLNTQNVEKSSSSSNQIPFEDFNKFNISKVESSEINNRELKTTKLIKNPITDLEELGIEEIGKYAYSLAKDQAGCRFLQKKLDETPSLANEIFPKLMDKLIELMNDSFGNYLIQKVLEKLSDEGIHETLNAIAPHFLGLGLNPHGTRVLQKIIELLKNDSLLNLYIKILTPNLLNFIKDINGNHIIQKFVFTIGAPKNQFIFDLINSKIVEIATHKHGCCVLQKCIEGADKSQRNDMINLIIKYTQIFILDQYGNYVVQYVIMLKDMNVNKQIADEFLKMNVISISKQKFSSNVIEKCFDNCNDDTKSAIIKEISHPEIVYHLLFDNYGNYGNKLIKSVLQKALAFAHEPYYTVLIKAINPHLEKLKHHFPFGNKLYIKLINSYSDLQNSKTIESLQNNENTNSYLINQNYNSINKRINKRNYHTNDNPKLKNNKYSSNYYN